MLIKRNKKSVILIALVCTVVIIALCLLSSGKYGTKSVNDFPPELFNEIQREQYHPRNVIPALLQNYEAMKNDIHTLNKTLNDMHHKAANSNMKIKSMEGYQENVLKKKTGYEEMTKEDSEPSLNVHAFYYPWYGNPEHEGAYYHWNHQYIQHWKEEEAKKWPSGRHSPPDDVGANFYPALGAYSSSDEKVIDTHMQMMKFAKIGVVVVSWYPPGDADAEGKQPDSLMPQILTSAQKHGLKVALHVEPYNGRDHRTWLKNLKYILKNYGSHPAFYRTNFKGKTNLPLYYIYDSYTVQSHQWAEIFSVNGKLSVRNTDLDGIFIGLLVEHKHQRDLERSGFDGVYTYFATNGFTYGSSWVNWKSIAKACMMNNMMFIPSVGPGYIDTEVRPWNGANKRKRLEGRYYNESFTNAVNVSPQMISITSFNEWHEGTQIEPAVVKEAPGRKYLNYGPHGENFYLNLTRQFVDKFNAIIK